MRRIPFARLRRPLGYAVGVLAIVGLLAWLMGAFHDPIPPGDARPAAPAAQGPRHTVATTRVRTSETAVGTVQAVQETMVASRLLGRIRTLHVQRAGQSVQQGELLVELDPEELRATVEAARAALSSAETRRDKAQTDLARSEQLAQQGIASPERVDTDRSTLRAATAEVERHRQQIIGAETALAYTEIRAPITGVVVDKLVNQGDIVQPGQPICKLYDPTRLMLVAVVREELAGRLSVGQEVDVTLSSMDKTCRGIVAEIVPQTRTLSRAFEVKVTGPCQPGVVTGMFGRLHVPIDERDELRVPRAAVRSTGQLDFVSVVADDGSAEARFVRTGRTFESEVEILSGLRAGEVVLLGSGK